jgi:hypothetical protein
VAVNVTAWPALLGLGEEVSATVVATGLTARLKVALALAPLLSVTSTV